MSLIICAALLAFVSCGKQNLSVPSGIDLDVDNNLTWDEDKLARSYKIEIVNVDTGERSERSSRRATFSLSGLAEGDYELRIKAVSGLKDYTDSAWSRKLDFHKDYETGCLYELIKNSTEYRIKKVGSASGTVKIEEKYRGKPVTSIASLAFRGSSAVEGVIIGGRVTEIGESAFWNCRALKSVTIPESVVKIEKAAFQSCSALEEIVIPSGITEIYDSTFAYCKSLKKVTISENVTAIGEGAFSDCTSLEELVIPNKVKTVGKYAFSNCGFTKVRIGDSVVSLGEYAFYKCANLTAVDFGEEGKLKDIGTYAFSECASLESLVLPVGVEDVQRHCFYDSAKLAEVVLPTTVKHVGQYAFIGTKIYADAIGDETAPAYLYVGDWLVATSAGLRQTITKIEPTTLKTDLVGIADGAFVNAKELLSIELAESVKYIGSSAFGGCEKLWQLTLPDGGVETIGDTAFAQCVVLGTVRLGNGLKEIGISAFNGCKLLDNSTQEGVVLIPDSVERIGTNAFYGTALYGKPDSATGVIYAGKWVVGYQQLASANITIKDSTVGIADYAFYKIAYLRSIDGVENVKHIGKGAFYGCTNLMRVKLNRTITKIDDYTFYKCSSLSIDETNPLPTNLRAIGRSAFYECKSLLALDLSGTKVTDIGMFAFYGCDLIKSIDFGDRVENISDKAFYKNVSLGKIVIPDSVKKIGEKAFFKDQAVKKIDLGNGIEEIGAYAFSTMPEIKSLVIPDSVKKIGDYAFYKHVNAETLVIGNNVEEIGNYAFFGMAKVGRLSIPSSVKKIGNYAFKGFARLTSVVLPTTIEELGTHAFYGAKNAAFYTDAAEIPGGWSKKWNSSYRPLVYGCVLSEDGKYVVSVTVGENTLENGFEFIEIEKRNPVSAPRREGYTFAGWATSENGEVEYTADGIRDVPAGTTVYSVWTEGDEPDLPIAEEQVPTDTTGSGQ